MQKKLLLEIKCLFKQSIIKLPIFIDIPSKHPFSSTYPVEGCGLAGVYPSCHGAEAGYTGHQFTSRLTQRERFMLTFTLTNNSDHPSKCH